MKNKILITLILLLICGVNKHTFEKQYITDNNNQTNIEIINLDTLLSKNGFIESKNKYHVANQYGCVGKYQFNLNSIDDLNKFKYTKTYITKIKKSIKYNKEEKCYHFDTTLLTKHEQENLIVDYFINVEFKYLKHSIKKYVGKNINGVRITKAGILSASFLGYHHVYNYLKSNGNINHSDGNGHSVKKRLKMFQNYEIEEDYYIQII